MTNSKKDEEMRLLYRVIIDDIRYSKGQQWRIIYLTLIGIGGIIGLFLRLCSEQNPPEGLRPLLVVISIVTALLGTLYIGRYQGDIERYRCTKNQLLLTFSREAQEIMGKKPKWYKKNEEFWANEFLWFIFLFCLLIAMSAGLGIYLISRI